MFGKVLLFGGFFLASFMFLQGLTVAPNYEEQQVTRFVYAESTCESPLTQEAVAFVIISSAKRAGIQPSRAIDLDSGFYLSSFRAATLFRANINTLIYFEDFTQLMQRKCASEAFSGVRKAFSLYPPTSIYHFDNCAGKAGWKDKLIAFKVVESDSTCLYANTQGEVDALRAVIQ